MYLVSVAPIRRGIPIDELSYFTKEPVKRGALVYVPMRGSSTPALVIRSIPAHEAKSDLKHAEYALKKLESIHATTFFREEFIEACEQTANYFAATTGAVVQAVFPNSLLTEKSIPGTNPETAQGAGSRGAKKHAQKFILQAEETERFATYKSYIREGFARGGSCYFILPSIQDIEHAYSKIEKGIQNYTFILHGGLSKKEIAKRWEEIQNTKHPVLIIGTPFFLAVPRNDIETIILDRESGNAYMLQGRPFVDLRYFAEQFAKNLGANFILGDLFLRTETLYREKEGEFEPLLRPKVRLSSSATQTIIDMRTSGEQPAAGRIAICSRELVKLIEETRKKGTHCFILGVRKGFAPMTVCGDCGTVVACTRCSAPLVLHRKQGVIKEVQGDVPPQTENPNNPNTLPNQPTEEAHTPHESPNIFLCHRCGLVADPETICSHCGGWRLIPLGIGIVQAEETIMQRFPDAHVFRLDRDSVKKHKDARALVAEFYQTPGSIMIGTEMALPYLTEPVGAVAVLSVNSLLTIPDFRMGERVFRLLLSLREKAREHFLIQTRDPDMPLFALATGGNIAEFLRTELEARHRLGYPPFGTLLKFTYEGTKADGTRIMEDIEKTFGMYHPVTFPSFIAKVKGKYHMNALIKIPPKEWPNPELMTLIRALPSEVIVRINPENVI
jgi:primosomal protein N' (replication factor Y)